jgi:hypothetical protein
VRESGGSPAGVGLEWHIEVVRGIEVEVRTVDR